MSGQPGRPNAPLVDHHQHLFSPALSALIASTPEPQQLGPVTADDLVGHLDDAGISRAVVLSTAYIFRQPPRRRPDARERLRRDNAWTGEQVARYPDRLIGFGSVDPLADWALDEIDRCAEDPHLRGGLKLHFGNSRVDYHDADHIERVRGVFAAANERRMAVVAHLRTPISRDVPYGREEARIFVERIAPAAPDVPIQIAHLGGTGSYAHDPAVDEVLAVFIEAMRREPRLRQQLWFDVTAVSSEEATPDQAMRLVSRLRQLGLGRILYGSDGAVPPNLPRRGWDLLCGLPLTDGEVAQIATNIAPHLAVRAVG